MSKEKQDEFNPLVHGLNKGENFEIGYEAGFYILKFIRNGCCPMFLLIIGAAALGVLAHGAPAGMLLIVIIYNMAALIAFILLAFYVLFMAFQVKRTKYFITNQRLLEVQGRRIVKQIPRTNLQNSETDQYLKSTFESKRGVHYNYNILVTDNISGVAILMTSLPSDISDTIERWVNDKKRKA
ncbi:hypothetical protein EU527_16360 [Candidatus Thorarchaeota archaeon]|nr:MAG: hypothetical protein EU527_16360 [Candidatus Thorarchaeota archaeon]